MKLEGTKLVNAEPERVWEVLNDVELLKKHMPGCEELRELGDGEYEAVISLGVSVIKGTYKAKLSIKDARPPVSYSLKIEGSGKPGFIKGEGQVRLQPRDGKTELHYSGDLRIGGLIARVGQRLIGGVAEKMTRQFFDGLAEEAEAR